MSSAVARSCSTSAQHAPHVRSSASSSPCAAWNSMSARPWRVHVAAAAPSSSSCPKYMNFSYPASGRSCAARLSAAMASAGSPNSASAMPYASAASAFAGARSTARFSSVSPSSYRSNARCSLPESMRAAMEDTLAPPLPPPLPPPPAPAPLPLPPPPAFLDFLPSFLFFFLLLPGCGIVPLGASLEGKVSRARCIPPEHTFCTSGARKVQSTSTSLVWRQARRLRGV
mmetsp:Transcript_34356/g.55104  ORF Transcript_34356/g.55104 Transcript_34356/m.55104 type:complete len:228 (+) Transcript_34356:1554-2237(+)